MHLYITWLHKPEENKTQGSPFIKNTSVTVRDQNIRLVRRSAWEQARVHRPLSERLLPCSQCRALGTGPIKQLWQLNFKLKKNNCKKVDHDCAVKSNWLNWVGRGGRAALVILQSIRLSLTLQGDRDGLHGLSNPTGISQSYTAAACMCAWDWLHTWQLLCSIAELT